MKFAARESRKVFSPLNASSPTITPLPLSLSASPTPSCTSTTSLTAPLGGFSFAELHATAAQRPAGSLAQHRLSGVARAPNFALSAAQVGRQGALTLGHQLPVLPMHFPCWPYLTQESEIKTPSQARHNF